MYGPVTEPTPPQRPRRGAEGATRVLFASLPILSCGLLAWLPALRIALLRARPRDWVVFAAVVALNAGFVAAIIAVPGSEEEGGSVPQTLAGLYALGFIIGSVVHAMVAGRTPVQLSAGRPGSPYATPYPGPGGPLGPPRPAAAPPSGGPRMPPGPPPAPAYPTPSPTPPPGPGVPPVPRMQQVRSELDELGERLRQREQR